ncbi:hypothetical protein Nepgr_002799 [Nepenthes gracilis]|uniref:Uncharacterized protein n=1 Tax=Nepenthes gracilis TaxID=150966 RepID=A0AAD3P4B0_NEPGR|nr:hypothetical protein Nepgr_002799 [Nepenthes gracilis]
MILNQASRASASGGPSKKAKPLKSSREQDQSVQTSRASNGTCDHCGRAHEGKPCYKKLGVCYNCGQGGHMIKNYPLAKQVPELRSPILAKVFTVFAKEAETSTKVVEGTLSICENSSHVLFDSGSTHLFVSHDFMKCLMTLPQVLGCPLMVASPTWSSIILNVVFPESLVESNGFGMPVNLVLLKMKDFDAILGMDWLARHHAKIDCSHKRVEFAISGNKPFYIQGVRRKEASCFISTLHAWHLIGNRCQVYLAFASVTEGQGTLTKEIPVICEFEDLFLDELHELPPRREIEFGIELVPGAAPISKVPYRMAPTELKELK